jgi:hypothetical protein
MSTRSNIAVERDDGTVLSIYCHFDGYPEHHADILANCYAGHKDAQMLVALGDMSVLDKNISQCVYYSRDRGEDLHTSQYASFQDFDIQADNDYAYIFRNGNWYGRKRRGEWRSAVDMFKPQKCETRHQNLVGET